jgi:hypothetical protein
MAEFADDGPQEIASGLFHFEPPGFLDKSKRKFAPVSSCASKRKQGLFTIAHDNFGGGSLNVIQPRVNTVHNLFPDRLRMRAARTAISVC